MDYKGAGVLIYKFSNNKLYFLLGKENLIISKKCNKGHKYCDFGGRRDKEDTNYIDTASREFYEETMGSLYSINEMKNKLLNTTVFFNERYKYHQFLLKEDISDEKIETFNKMRSYLNSCMKMVTQDKEVYYLKLPCCPDGYVEKSEIRWFDLNEILSNTTMFRNEFLNSLTKILEKDVLKYN